MADASKWGKKFTCFKCGCKFYDLNRTQAICPKCKVDQADKAEEEFEEPASEEVVEEEKASIADEEVEVPEEGAAAGEEELPEMEEDLGYEEPGGADEEE